MRVIKKAIAAASACLVLGVTYAQNIGFEAGNTSGWSGTGLSAVGSQTLQAGQNQWTINPYGSYMGKLTIQSGTFSGMTSAMGLNAGSISTLQNMLTTQATANNFGNGTVTTTAYATKTVTLTAGQTFTLAWQYISTDYVPFNDGSIATLTKVGSPNTTAVLNNYTAQSTLLGFTVPGTGDYSTGSYGSTGWQVATFTATEAGDYILGFGVFNLEDSALSPVLYVDEVQGTTLKNGTTFGAVAPNPGTSAPDASSGSVTPPAPTPTPAPTLVNDLSSGVTTSAQLGTNPVFNGGTLQIVADATTMNQLFGITGQGATIDANGLVSTFNGVISNAVSGTPGALTITNTATGGSVTLTAQNTYTGVTTITQGATLNNTGSIAASSGVNNAGTFNNSGTAPNVNNTGTFNNSGTAGDVNNSGFFNNLFGGIISMLTNTGTAVNDGTTGTVNNSGTFTNNGTTGDLTNTGTVVNAGSVGAVVNSAGTFTNYGSAGGVFNDALFNNIGGVGDVVNNGVFNNMGTTGSVTNNNLFANNGTTGDVNNSGIFVSTGTSGAVTNSGSFTLTQPGSIGSINNSGIFNMSTAGSPVTVGSYTQSSTGITVMTVAPGTIQQLNVIGTADLGGAVVFKSEPGTYKYGVYPFLTASSITGSYMYLGFDPDYISPLGFDLVQTNNSVGLKITPSAAYTLASINQNVGSIMTVNNLQMSTLDGSLNYDCVLYGERNMCISAGARYTTDSAGNASGGSLTVGKKVNPNFRVGAFMDQGFNNITSNNVTLKTGMPMVGAYAHWNQDSRGYGWGVHASAAYSSNKMSITRTGTAYSEAGTGTPTATGDAIQLKATYSYPIGTRLTVNPYVGLRYTQLDISAYTESNAVYPLSYKGLTQSATDALAGVGASYNFGRVVGYVSGGVVQNLSYTAGSLSGTSGIVNLGTYNVALPGSNYTSMAFGAGVTIDVARNQYLNLGLGWQQKSLVNTNVSSFNASYTVGF
ncbi:Autotransporter beta-domain containing protein [uncultured Caudovirales phage]|uniref:Autotransporter beta-domain containing protein n=1 Tax=uncultured Caudovirales phage TaxID=2100421 RepID=A0A6J7WGZ4_9CAUD|nr:Autotransporter beta-domain containing protein [uncultured Caudovirales phage]